MAEARFSQYEFTCSLCLDLLKDPVSIQCGHSYCKSCITDHWDKDDQQDNCPQCKQTFSPRPALATNTMLAEVVEKLKNNKQQKETQKMFQQRIQQKENDLQQLREAVESQKSSTKIAVEGSEWICTKLIQLIRDQEKRAVSGAEGRLERLEQEINDLKKRDAELEQLSHGQYRIHYQQLPPEPTDEMMFSYTENDDLFSSLFPFDALRESVHQLRDKLEDLWKDELKKISDRVTFTNTVPRTRNDFLQYSRQLTLDLNTLHKLLCLSENNTVITHTDTDQSYPDHPDRFDVYQQVLCRESVSGRCYWEIEWSGNYVRIAVSYKSISRKGEGNESMFGCNAQSWSFCCTSSRYSFGHNSTLTALPVQPISSRIGVFVDHGAGTLSFYNVSDTMSLIYTVQTTFTQPLYPGFEVGSGSSLKLINQKTKSPPLQTFTQTAYCSILKLDGDPNL